MKNPVILDFIEILGIAFTAPPDDEENGPATGFGVILKDNSGERVDLAFKTSDQLNEEEQIVYGVLYAPGKVDNQGEMVQHPAVLRETLTRFMKDNTRARNVKKTHYGEIADANVCEAWMTRTVDGRKDPLFPNVPDGSIAVGIKINDPVTWGKFKSGELGGLSLEGACMTAAKSGVATAEGNDESVGILGKITLALDSILSRAKKEPKEEDVTTAKKEEVKEDKDAPFDASKITELVSSVKTQIDGLGKVIDEKTEAAIKPVNTKLEEVGNAFGSTVKTLTDTITALTERLEALEKKPDRPAGSATEIGKPKESVGLFDSLMSPELKAMAHIDEE